jgi:hypothetical protein
VPATGGASSGGVPATGGASSGGGLATGGAYGTGGGAQCPSLPTEQKYSCEPRVTQTGDCSPYRDASVGPQLLPPLTYPPGCTVLLPRPTPGYPCTPMGCTCTLPPVGSTRGTWVCAP